MCRFLAYQGKPIRLDELLYKPKNSLIRQSAQAHEAEEPLNGDGFGVGWYTPEVNQEPGLYVSIRPAWNDRNLRYLSQHIMTHSFCAHVRAASEGEVSESNCHPFHFGDYLFMHNGGIGDFLKVKRRVRRGLSDEIYDWIRGQTDSEHLFALILEKIKAHVGKVDVRVLAQALKETVGEVQKLKAEHGVTEPCYINCVLSNGSNMVAVRYVSDPIETPSTLYYSLGESYVCKDGVCYMVPGKPQSVLVVSEKLNDIGKDWTPIPANHMLLVDEKMQTQLLPIGPQASASSQPKADQSSKGFRPSRHRRSG
jgi:glutamine amidotransferase